MPELGATGENPDSSLVPNLSGKELPMSKNEKSSKEVASLAGTVLQQKANTEAAKKLAGSVLTQTPDKKSWGSKKK